MRQTAVSEEYMKVRDGNWIHELVRRGVLVRIEEEMCAVPGGVILVCDSETNPAEIVVYGVEDSPVRVIANEAGVLIASPDTRMHAEIGIDQDTVLLQPIERWINEGIRRIILCANPHSISGPLLALHPVDLIDHLMRAGQWLTERTGGEISISYLVHAPTGSEKITYDVTRATWRAFYHWYETAVLHRLDDGIDIDDLEGMPRLDHAQA